MGRFSFTLSVILLPMCLIASNLQGSSGGAPEFTFNLKLNNRFSLTSKVESFHILLSDGGGEWGHHYEGTDIQLFTNYRVNPLVRFAVGYQRGIKYQKNDTHRSIQQLSLLGRRSSFILSHRFRSDQTFYATSATKFRARYRISFEFPLKGRTIDPRRILFAYLQ